ncbi:MAG: hypothetical protein QF766_03955 [Candidatus Poseidoniia archaeon]|nr:hypothetical protein [Candidatus Poseidoniia archaeon]
MVNDGGAGGSRAHRAAGASLLLLALACLALGASGEKAPEWEYILPSPATDIALSDDGVNLSAGWGNRLGWFYTNSSVPLKNFQRDAAGPMALSADGKYLFAAGEGNDGGQKLTLWEERAKEWNPPYGAAMTITDVDVSADGAYLVAGDYNGNIYVFRRQSSTPIWTASLSEIGVLQVAISPGGTWVAAGTQSGEIHLYERSSGNESWVYPSAPRIYDLEFAREAPLLAVASGSANSGQLYLFSNASNEPLVDYPISKAVTSVAVHRNGSWLAGGADDGKVYLISAQDGGTEEWSYSLGTSVDDIAANGVGTHLLAGGGNKQLALLAVADGVPLWTTTVEDPITCVAASWRGEYLAVGQEDRLALFYEVALDNQPPNATIVSISPSTAMPGWNVTFSGSGEDSDGSVVGYYWRSSRDGGLSNEAQFNVSWLSAGYHTIFLKVQDNDGLWGAEVSTEVAIGDFPTATLEPVIPCPGAGDCVVNQGDTVTFTGSGTPLTNVSAAINAFWWESSRDGPLSTAAQFSTSALSRGWHTITFRISNTDGFWSANVTATLRVNGQPTAYIASVSPNPALVGQTVMLSGDGLDPEGDAVTYLWNSSRDGFLGDSTLLYLGQLSVGEHLVTLAVRDSDGFWSASVNRTLAVWSPPTVTALCPEDGIVGDELYFSANASDSDGQVILYEWDFQSPTGVLLKVDNFGATPGAYKVYDRMPPGDELFYNIVLRVTDDDSLSSTANCVVFMSEPAPPATAGGAGDSGGFSLDLGEVAGIPATTLLAGVLLLMLLMVGGTWFMTREQPPPSLAAPTPLPPPAAAPSPIKRRQKRARRKATVETVTIECPGCSARMEVPKTGGVQTVECDSCGLSGEMEL